MDIAHITTVHPAFDTRIFQKELQSLHAAGHDTTLLAYHKTSTIEDGIRIESLGTTPSRYERWLSLPCTYRQAKAVGADVYHLHDPELLPVGRALSQRTDAAVVYDVHENFDNAVKFRDYIPDRIKPLVARSVVPVQSTLAASMDAIVTATEWIAEDFEDRGHDPIVTVRNFPVLTGINLDETQIEPDHEYLLSFVGNLADNRGLVRMVDITKRLRDKGYDVGLWVIGPYIDEDIERSVTRQIADHELADHVRLFGYVDYENIFPILHRTDVGLMLVDPGLYHGGLPNKMFEYMAAEIPVVANRTQSVEQYIPETCGIIVDDDIDQQIRAIRKLLDDGTLRARMGTNGRKKAQSEYNWDIEKEGLLNLYSHLESLST